LHLISSFQYPKVQHLQLQDIIRFLSQAPQIVNEARPVSWTYLGIPPEDGVLFLEWIPIVRSQVFASDGYVWGDPERGHEKELTRELTNGMLNGEYVGVYSIRNEYNL
jgi:hypothetical protein